MTWIYIGAIYIILGIIATIYGVACELKHRPFIEDGRHIVTFSNDKTHTLYTLGNGFVDDEGKPIKGKLLGVILKENDKENQ